MALVVTAAQAAALTTTTMTRTIAVTLPVGSQSSLSGKCNSCDACITRAILAGFSDVETLSEKIVVA